MHFEVDRKEKQLRGETAARQQLELQLDRLANQVFICSLICIEMCNEIPFVKYNCCRTVVAVDDSTP